MFQKDLRFTLYDLLNLVDKTFKQVFEEFTFWVECEVTRAKFYNGKYYLDLVQFDENQKVIAKARGIIWNSIICESFFQKFKIKSFEDLKGYKFLFHGRLNFHYEYGFSIHIDAISDEFILGQLKKTQDYIRQKLISENIFDKNKNLPLPYPPFVIAVISSSTSEGLKDFKTILEKSDYNFEVILYESPIHGNQAKDGVLQALRKVYKDIINGKKIDFVAILRGGGGSYGIVWQNDERIARGVCHMPVPVIIAIGHTSDKYILDEVAKISAKTPSDAARLLIDLVESYVKNIDEFKKGIDNLVENKFKLYIYEIDKIYDLINQQIKFKLNKYTEFLDFYYDYIKSFDIKRLLKKGFAVLVDKFGNILSKNQIENLKIGDEVGLKVLDKNFIIQVKNIK